MPCFIRICPHYHPSEFSNAKVLLCIWFGAALLCLPMSYMKLVCSALQCCSCHLTVSFLYWAVVPSRRVWISYILSDSSTEGHTLIHALIMHSAPVTETCFFLEPPPGWCFILNDLSPIWVPLTMCFIVLFPLLVILASDQRLQILHLYWISKHSP